jgi:intracellular septation protein A
MRALLHEKIALPLRIWNRLNLSWSLFCGTRLYQFMCGVRYSTDSWGISNCSASPA